MNKKVILFALLLSGIQFVSGQDALTSVKVNIQNVTISSDRKTISYDVYIQDIDASYPIAIPGYVFRLAVPQADLGTNAKTVTVTNASTELGAAYATMTVSGTNWLMKFLSANLIISYNSALLASETFPGTRLARFNISNTDGTSFANPQAFNPSWSGSTVSIKSTMSIFVPNTTTLANNSTSALPATSFTGIQSYSLAPVIVNKSINLKVYLEGLWNSGSQNMNKCKEWSDDIQDVVDKFPGDIADKVTIELHGTPYSNIAYTFSDLELHQDGTVTSSGLSYISIPSTISGSYYITVQTRNHIETTTASMVSFSTATIDYDFTDAVTKAFESDASFTPTKEIDGKWMLYAGDDLRNTVSPEIEFGDLYEIFNNKSADTEIYGYLPIDLNGDGVADESDMYLMFANNTIFFYIE